MELNADDVREILRIVDETELEEVRIETDGLKLLVRLAGAPAPSPEPEPRPARPSEAPAPEATPAAEPAAENGEEVAAPMLGIFFRAPGPAEPPYVEVGSRIEPDTVVGLIEVMKLMNSVAAGVAGTVAEVCAENGAMVEYGQPLIRVVPGR